MISDPIHTINDKLTIIDGPSGDGGERNRGYLLGKESFTIINTGRKGSIENTFLEAIHNKGKEAKHVKYIFITHPYPDVIGGVYRLKKMFPKAQVAIHEKCKEIMDDPNTIRDENFKFTRKEKLYFAVKKDPFDDLEKFKPDIYFKDGDKFELDNTKLMVINFDSVCKGHSMFFATNERAMFTGDALNLYPALPSSYLIDFTGSYKEWLKNLTFLEKAQNISMICPAHDGYQEDRHVIPYISDVKEAFHQFESQLEMVMTEQKYLTMNELIERVHNSQGIVWYHPFSIIAPKANMTAHLAKLLDEEKIQRNDKTDPITYTYIAPKDEFF